ncbi:GNAT family N-acetyltransferase [bacterium]|nr:GNAT family N-acetyltransferase [bacterium]
MKRITLNDGREVHFKTAGSDDTEAIIGLYQEVYKGSYTLREVQDPKILEKKVEDPNYFWTLAFLGNRIIGSVIFTIDPINKIGKSYAAVVLEEFRGQDIMRFMVLQALERLTKLTRTCDVIYATTRTVSFAPQVVLEHLGFFPMGIFPNVRKVASMETHGLEIFFREDSLKMRRPQPLLVPEAATFYNIVRDVLNLEECEEQNLPLSDPRKMGSTLNFRVERDEKVLLRKFDDYQNKDLMDKVFFPFTEPNLLFVADDESSEIFVNFNRTDGHAVIVAYRSQTDDLRRVIMWFCEAASKEGIRYIELLVNAFRPDLQRITIDAKFLPCAYFPSMRLNERNQREDYLVFSRSFETLRCIHEMLV